MGTREFVLTGDINKYKDFAKADLELCPRARIVWICNSYSLVGLVHFWRGRWQKALECGEERRLREEASAG